RYVQIEVELRAGPDDRIDGKKPLGLFSRSAARKHSFELVVVVAGIAVAGKRVLKARDIHRGGEVAVEGEAAAGLFRDPKPVGLVANLAERKIAARLLDPLHHAPDSGIIRQPLVQEAVSVTRADERDRVPVAVRWQSVLRDVCAL